MDRYLSQKITRTNVIKIYILTKYGIYNALSTKNCQYKKRLRDVLNIKLKQPLNI